MASRDVLDKIKAFGMTNQLVTGELSQIERTHDIVLGHVPPVVEAEERDYYPQLDAAARAEAARMARHYEVFYALERTIRALVNQTLEEADGTADWWAGTRAAAHTKSEVEQRIQKELHAGVSRRSDDALDYTTFGELAQIITGNWAVFGALFTSKSAVERVLTNLNAIRNPIAHCCAMGDDEEIRLRLAVRDWFRCMEVAR
ncbi:MULTISPECIES: Swt1 family HEPN domain-containing protein [Hyphomicrobiales]|jgi:hypothetical protein|uniref:Swt1 family HEPN domain-containing protein n=1 Tax=Methylobacterium sp. CCH7-A2 TaxID=1768789 RepID=UPI000AF7A547|nr:MULTISPECIES: Swt1 family HEPN domain-containing protein [Hyphomicrobiales]